MKNGHFMPLCVMLFTLLLLFAFACCTESTKTPNGYSGLTLNEVGAKATLEKYLSAREEGQHEKAARFLTNGLLKKFDEMYGGYVDFHRTDEASFKDAKILRLKEPSDGIVITEVSVIVEGEGYRHNDAREQYHMIQEEGSWKIDDWQIEYREADEWPFDY